MLYFAKDIVILYAHAQYLCAYIRYQLEVVFILKYCSFIGSCSILYPGLGNYHWNPLNCRGDGDRKTLTNTFITGQVSTNILYTSSET